MVTNAKKIAPYPGMPAGVPVGKGTGLLSRLANTFKSLMAGLAGRVSAELVAFAIGLILFSIGLYLAWPPLGLIGPGIVLMAIALFGESQRQPPAEDE